MLILFAGFGSDARAQDMEARAYSPAPVGANVAVFVYSFQTGDVLFDPSIPLKDVKVTLNATAVGYGRTLGLFGRQTTVSAALPYAWGRVRGTVFEQAAEITRSGLGDLRLRVAVNLMGSPALSPREFAARKPATTLGASFSVILPTGQYDPRRLVNLGVNRFAFKPEMGLSQPVGRWTLELNAGAWFFTDNKDFFGGVRREQKPIATLQGHVVYTIRARMWLACDGTYYTGGRTILNGVLNQDLLRNSRIGVTFSLPVTRTQSFKVSWAKGLTALVGGDLNTITIGWQYAWVKQ
jgi:outer membrane putative beta-barrel porin/alpha-amylase